MVEGRCRFTAADCVEVFGAGQGSFRDVFAGAGIGVSGVGGAVGGWGVGEK